MEENLNKILSELQQLNTNQEELMVVQKELLERIVHVEKAQKKLPSTKNITKVHEDLLAGQHQLKVQIQNLEQIKNIFSLEQDEIKELIKQTTAYLSGKMSFSERIKMEMELLNLKELQEILNEINANRFPRKSNHWAENWNDDPYHDF